MQIRIDVPSLFDHRTTSLASTVPGMIHPGEEVVLSWTPETDLLGDPLSAAFYRTGGGCPIFSLNARRDPQDIRLLDSSHLWLRVPRPDPLQGDLPIAGFLSPFPISMPVEPCEGAGCRTSVDRAVEAVFLATPESLDQFEKA